MIEIAKNVREVIRVRPVEFNGVELLDVRVWLPGVGGDDEGQLTRKGLTLRVEVWAEVVAAVEAVAGEMGVLIGAGSDEGDGEKDSP